MPIHKQAEKCDLIHLIVQRVSAWVDKEDFFKSTLTLEDFLNYQQVFLS